MAILQLNQIRKSYGLRPVLNGIDLAIARLLECPDYVLSPKELATAALAAKRKPQRRG